MKNVTFVIPVYNEETALPELFAELTAFFEDSDGLAFEAVLVDDGSTDRSWRLIHEQHAKDSRFRAVRLSRNFGHQTALTAGLDLAEGDAVIVMDADLQDPLDVAGEMLDAWRAGHDVVYGQREAREGEGWIKRSAAFAFYRFMKLITRDPTPRDVGDFYLLSRQALTELRRMREHNRYLRGMVFWLGFDRKCIRYRRRVRASGTTKYRVRDMVSFAIDGILSSSGYPLVVSAYAGVFIALISSLLAFRALFVRMTNPNFAKVASGWTSIFILVLFMGGVQLTTMGVIGLYLSRVYNQVKNRPLYILRDMCGTSPSAGEEPPADSPSE